MTGRTEANPSQNVDSLRTQRDSVLKEYAAPSPISRQAIQGYEKILEDLDRQIAAAAQTSTDSK